MLFDALMIIVWRADSFCMLLVPNYVQKHTKMDKKLKFCFDFTEGVPATLQGKEEGGEYILKDFVRLENLTSLGC